MATETKLSSDQSIGPLVGGIVNDAQHLVKQHLDLFRQEVREDLRKTTRVAVAMVVEYLLVQSGFLFVVALLVGVLAWAVPTAPWWIWCGIAGFVMLLAAAVVAGTIKKMISTLNLKPGPSAAALQEDLQWLKK